MEMETTMRESFYRAKKKGLVSWPFPKEEILSHIRALSAATILTERVNWRTVTVTHTRDPSAMARKMVRECIRANQETKHTKEDGRWTLKTANSSRQDTRTINVSTDNSSTDNGTAYSCIKICRETSFASKNGWTESWSTSDDFKICIGIVVFTCVASDQSSSYSYCSTFCIISIRKVFLSFTTSTGFYSYY